MRGAQMFMFIVLIPALAALGHDLYLFYLNQDKGFMLSTPGYMWTHYDEPSYKWTVENTDPALWSVIDYILSQKALVVGVVFAGFFWLLIGLMKLFKLGPFHVHDPVVSGRLKGGRVKYSRK